MFMYNVKRTGGLYNGEVWNPQTNFRDTFILSYQRGVGQALYRKHKGLHQGIDALQLFDCQGHASCSVQHMWHHLGREDRHAVQCGYRVGIKLPEFLFDFR